MADVKIAQVRFGAVDIGAVPVDPGLRGTENDPRVKIHACGLKFFNALNASYDLRAMVKAKVAEIDSDIEFCGDLSKYQTRWVTNSSTDGSVKLTIFFEGRIVPLNFAWVDLNQVTSNDDLCKDYYSGMRDGFKDAAAGSPVTRSRAPSRSESVDLGIPPIAFYSENELSQAEKSMMSELKQFSHKIPIDRSARQFSDSMSIAITELRNACNEEAHPSERLNHCVCATQVLDDYLNRHASMIGDSLRSELDYLIARFKDVIDAAKKYLQYTAEHWTPFDTNSEYREGLDQLKDEVANFDTKVSAASQLIFNDSMSEIITLLETIKGTNALDQNAQFFRQADERLKNYRETAADRVKQEMSKEVRIEHDQLMIRLNIMIRLSQDFAQIVDPISKRIGKR